MNRTDEESTWHGVRQGGLETFLENRPKQSVGVEGRGRRRRAEERQTGREVESARMTARRHKSSAFKRIYEPEKRMEAEQREEGRKKGEK